MGLLLERMFGFWAISKTKQDLGTETVSLQVNHQIKPQPAGVKAG